MAADTREHGVVDPGIEGLLENPPAPTDSDAFVEGVVSLAGALLVKTQGEERREDKTRLKQLAGLMEDRPGQLFTTLLTDRVTRLRSGSAILNQARHALKLSGQPSSFGPLDTLLLKGLGHLGFAAPPFVGHLIRQKIEEEASAFLVPGEIQSLQRTVREMRQENVDVNINKLGEEVLGNDQAKHHMAGYLELLELPEVDTISVKVSSISAQLDTLAMDENLERVCHELRILYRKALSTSTESCGKLVMLDMESYRDLELTYRAFTTVLKDAEFSNLRAGIVLQAYLPDSHLYHEKLIAFARARVGSGGAPLQMRVVKGANLAAELIESSQSQWALPIFESKAHVDASFKRMLLRGIGAGNLHFLRLGIASHNVFDVAYGMLLRAQNEAPENLHFEVLSGMAAPMTRALQSMGQRVLVYCPSVTHDSLHSAVAYLVRRMDENTSDENYLRHSFTMKHGDISWRTQVVAFKEAQDLLPGLDMSPKRETRNFARDVGLGSCFVNEVDTDFTVPGNRQWVRAALASQGTSQPVHGIVVGGETLVRKDREGFDPSRPGEVPYTFTVATPAEIARALACAACAQKGWAAVDISDRCNLLRAIADRLRQGRPQLIAALVMDGGKGVHDADSEVSEAIDFAEYYARSAEEWHERKELELSPRGVTVIAPPWNFPLAIPLGGVFAALVMGNAVILKPAMETVSIAHLGMEMAYGAGLSREVVQLVVADDKDASELITSNNVSTVVLTGGSSTARLFLKMRPWLHLLAETGGKNALIVTDFADRDLAVNCVVQSAFGHSGQKCSAASLLILTRGVAEDPHFQQQLVDATRSLPVGSAWAPETRVNPVIHAPDGVLLEGLNTLEAGEEWWVKPEPHPDNPRLWSPGIKAGVQEGSFAHRTEFFGPLLSVLVAEDLTEALRVANGTPYGLTAGLHSLDEREQEQFMEEMDAGNLYVNRTTTGAVVQRQPFGGRKDSAFGLGAKAGGPNYVAQFVTVEDSSRDGGATVEPMRAARLPGSVGDVCRSLLGFVDRGDKAHLVRATEDYLAAYEKHFSRKHDPSRLLGQDNLFRYQTKKRVALFVGRDASRFDVARAALAGLVSGSPFDLVLCPEKALWRNALESALGPLRVTVATGEQSSVLVKNRWRVRSIGASSSVFGVQYGECVSPLATLDFEPIVSCGRAELMHWCEEQSISVDFHRYGNLGARA